MARQHILLVESRPNLQHSLSLILKQEDYRVSLADTAEEAISRARALRHTPEAVALLIADLESPSPETGRSFIHALSASGLDMPYLALAEEICDQTADALKKHGCLACLIKPFEPAILLRSVHDALDRSL
jgi:DNA-binding response OmpR family regulator